MSEYRKVDNVMSSGPEARGARFPVKCIVLLGLALATGLGTGLVCARIIVQHGGFEEQTARYLLGLIGVYVIFTFLGTALDRFESHKSMLGFAWLLTATLLGAVLIAMLFGSPALRPIAIAAIAAHVFIWACDIVPNAAKTLSRLIHLGRETNAPGS